MARSKVFALFAVCGEVGAVAGPVLDGLLLLAVDFTVTALTAAGVFVVILTSAKDEPAQGRAGDRPLRVPAAVDRRSRASTVDPAAVRLHRRRSPDGGRRPGMLHA